MDLEISREKAINLRPGKTRPGLIPKRGGHPKKGGGGKTQGGKFTGFGARENPIWGTPKKTPGEKPKNFGEGAFPQKFLGGKFSEGGTQTRGIPGGFF